MAKLLVGLFIIAMCSLDFMGVKVSAGSSYSNDYELQETALGGIGYKGSQLAIPKSADYQLEQSSGGILGFGTSADSTLQIKAGHTNTAFPALSFGVVSPDVDFGTFSPTSTAIGTASFEASDYTSYGYVVEILGSAPSFDTHTISSIYPAGTSEAGIEQFGINLVANTSPVSFGAGPNHGQFGYGSPTGNYSNTNNYQFLSGDNIASAPQTSGLTIYTISYIVNVSSITPAGPYTGSQTLICTATY